nr:hypothetical protein FFPRI1PSEUD_24260 [Pseudomonas sp. FFPRI_1]
MLGHARAIEHLCLGKAALGPQNIAQIITGRGIAGLQLKTPAKRALRSIGLPQSLVSKGQIQVISPILMNSQCTLDVSLCLLWVITQKANNPIDMQHLVILRGFVQPLSGHVLSTF